MLFSSNHRWILPSLLSLLLVAPNARATVDFVELYYVDYPPYMIVDEAGKSSGIDVEVTKAAFAAVGINTDIRLAPWKRILKSMQRGRIAGTLSCSRRPEREPFMIFSNQLNEIRQVAIMSRNADASGLSSVDDFTKYKVIAIEDWGNQRELERRGIAHETTAGANNAINSVVFRGVDLFYNGEISSRYHARQLGLQDNIKVIPLEDKESTPLYLCLSKEFPDSEYLRDRFNEGLKIIKRNGIFKAIYAKYL